MSRDPRNIHGPTVYKQAANSVIKVVISNTQENRLIWILIISEKIYIRIYKTLF